MGRSLVCLGWWSVWQILRYAQTLWPILSCRCLWARQKCPGAFRSCCTCLNQSSWIVNIFWSAHETLSLVLYRQTTSPQILLGRRKSGTCLFLRNMPNQSWNTSQIQTIDCNWLGGTCAAPALSTFGPKWCTNSPEDRCLANPSQRDPWCRALRRHSSSGLRSCQ